MKAARSSNPPNPVPVEAHTVQPVWTPCKAAVAVSSNVESHGTERHTMRPVWLVSEKREFSRWERVEGGLKGNNKGVRG